MVEPGTGDVKALAQSRPMGRDKTKGETYLNYVVPQKYGDSNGFQAGSTFKVFVLATALRQGIPTRHHDQRAGAGVHPDERVPDLRRAATPAPRSGTRQNSDGSGGTFDLYTGTQQSVNTFFAQPRAATGLCEPYDWPRTWAST